jgi:hypothetical protein
MCWCASACQSGLCVVPVQAAQALQERLQQVEADWQHRHDAALAERSRSAAAAQTQALSSQEAILEARHQAERGSALHQLAAECAP